MEFQKRAGHRFNLITRSLPKDAASAVQADELLQRLKRLGYPEGIEQLKVDLGALIKRGEISISDAGGKEAYYVLPKGIFETRKRTALIRIHNVDISEEDLELLEQISRRGKPIS